MAIKVEEMVNTMIFKCKLDEENIKKGTYYDFEYYLADVDAKIMQVMQ